MEKRQRLRELARHAPETPQETGRGSPLWLIPTAAFVIGVFLFLSRLSSRLPAEPCGFTTYSTNLLEVPIFAASAGGAFVSYLAFRSRNRVMGALLATAVVGIGAICAIVYALVQTVGECGSQVLF